MMEKRHTQHGQYIGNESVSDLNELHGWFQYFDAQSDTSRAFANNAIHQFIEAAKEAEIVKDATGLSPRELAEQREYLRGVLDEIGGLCRYLRQGGADPMDLQGLEEGLSVAVDMAHDALEATK